MRSSDDLFPYQRKAVNIQCTHTESALWLDMGLGKSVITLTSIAHLINCGYLTGVLIVAPIRVCRLVWRQESLKWNHTNHLTFSMLVGTKDQRSRALLRKADVYLTNYENLRWLAETVQTYFVSKGRQAPFDGIVFDEISKCKNSSTNRVKAFLKIKDQFKWSTGLTGTPAANGYADLHGQYLVLDGGKRLGTSKTAFKNRFYYKSGHYKYKPYDNTESEIETLIGDITLQMSAADYNPLPDMVVNDVMVDLEPSIRAKYDTLERDFFFYLDSGEGVEVFNAASLTNKLLQFSNGAVYPIPGMSLWEGIHDQKLDALEDIIEEANGQQILCAYAYRSDAERIMQRFKHLRPINLTECKSEASLRGAMARWKDGDCPLMIGHPACLHPRTQVLTEQRGWVSIVDVEKTDRVFDGVEFVSHEGCIYSGYKQVITRFGITMTPDHKIMVGDEWMEAKDVRDCEDIRRKAVYRRKMEDSGDSPLLTLRKGVGDASTKRSEAQQTIANPLSALHRRSLPSNDGNSHLENMDGNAKQGVRDRRNKGSKELSWSRDSYVRGMEGLREFLQRYVRRIFRRPNHRTDKCQRALLQGELSMGVNVRTAIEQAEQQSSGVSRRTDALSRIVSKVRFQQNDVNNEIEQGNVRRRGSRGLQELELRERSETIQCKTQTESHVYDLVNCGPRNRFVVRNDEEEMFISHNSMGHGVDGLQDAGHIIVWFGLNWSLDLYEQFNARVRRQGQGVPVICHRILTQNTLDQAQMEALDEKATTQNALRAAVKRYRDGKR